MPATKRSRVVLPGADGPSSTTKLPAGTSRETSSSATASLGKTLLTALELESLSHWCTAPIRRHPFGASSR